jgi:MerR family transcriptional regulator, heat shock protein HspR
MTSDRTRRDGRQEQIPHDEPLFQISVVSRIVGIHQQTIRSYERIGLIRPARSSGNTRLFSQHDVQRLSQVVRLINDLGVNLAGVEVILRMSRQIERLQRELAEARAALEGREAPPDGGADDNDDEHDAAQTAAGGLN